MGTRKHPAAEGSVLLHEYRREISYTDRLPKNDLRPVLLGLYGEVGGILAAAKKLDREGDAYRGYKDTVTEEFGDTLWYFATLCKRLGLNVEDVFSAASNSSKYRFAVAASDVANGSISRVSTLPNRPPPHETFLALGGAVAPLLNIRDRSPAARETLVSFADIYLNGLAAAELRFSDVVRNNISKTRGRFIRPNFSDLPTFDSEFPIEEQLLSNFEIAIAQRKSGQSYLQLNGVFIGDPLTDNIADEDGYRFHDVFHFAHAAILHWSPVMRALLKRKRKSIPKYDHEQDGGRANVVEEGLTAWIFSRAKKLDHFRDQKTISFDMLKTIQQFVSGYEVELCPLALWERAILQGYEVFRQVRANQGGVIVGDRKQRTLKYRKRKTVGKR